MSDIKRVFALFHIYDRIIDDITDREVKRIGFFETREECLDLIDEFKHYVGFEDHPEECFKIFEYEIGREYWRDEFLLYEDES